MAEKCTYEELEQKVRELSNVLESYSQREKALKESENYFRAFFEHNLDGIVVLDPETARPIDFNDQVCRQLGYSREEFAQLRLPDIEAKETSEETQSHIQKVLKNGFDNFETFQRTKNGEIRHVHVSAQMIDIDGRQVYHCIWRDITERKLAEVALQESEEQFRRLFKYHSAVMLVFDPKTGNIINANEAAIGFYGWSVEELQKMQIQQINTMPPEVVKAEIEKALLPEFTKAEYRHQRKDGSIRDVEVFRNPIEISGKTLVFAIIHDITERKQMMQRLRESESLLSSIFRAAPTGIGVVSNRILLAVNDRVCDMIGYSREEMIGQSARMLYPSDAHFEIVGTEKYRQILQYGTGTVETQWRCKDGRIIDILMSSTPINPLDHSEGVTFTALDITERKKVEDALREREEKYRNLLESIEEAYFEVDLNGNFTFYNDSLSRIIGYSRDELMGMNNRQYMDKENARKVFETFNQVYTTGKAAKAIDWKFITKDGSERFVEASISLKWDREGQPTGFQGIARNITGRKHAEEALRESEEKFRLTFSSSPDAVNINRLEDGLYVDINEGFTRATGYTREEVIGRTSLEIDIWHDPADRQKLVLGLHEKGYYENLEALFRMKDGSLITALISARIISLKGVPHIISIVRDITARKKTEEAIAKERTFSDNIINSLPGIFYMFDDLGKLVRWNRKFEEVAGYSHEELPGMQPTDFFSEEHKSYIALRVLSVFSEGEAFAEAPFLTKEGDSIPYFFTGRLTVLDGKQHLLGVGVDITERLRVEEEKDALQAKLQQAQKFEAIGTLAGGVAHDFNNLLMGIQGRASLLSFDLEPSHPHWEHVNAIEEYIRSATSLTKQLLGFARGGKYEVNPVDMNELVHGSSAMFGRTKKEIQIHTKCQGMPLVVEADRGQIEQMLLNMYINAWQAMPPGGGHLYLETKIVMLDEASCKPHQVEPGHYVKLSITDTGAGMDEVTRLRIFDPFFTTKEMGRGTGLGLASAYGIIKNHGGMITVYSEIGHGTSFNIYLPVSDKVAHQEVPTESGLIRGSATILLVDDEELIIDVGQAMLERLGYRVVVCKGGQEAVKMVTDMGDEIELVILDMIMPGMDGGTTFDRIREIQPDMPVILSSGYAINSNADKIMRRGCSGFIQKPYNISELSQKIGKVLEKVKGFSHA